MRESVLGMILAGGEGRRLENLTSNVRAQPAVPFGGKYRIIDFVLSNFFNSSIKKIYVLIQHKSYSLVKHIEDNWTLRLGTKDEFIRILGPMPPRWQKGTADGIWQNLSRVRIENPDLVAVFGGDHIYRMDINSMVDFHRAKEAHLTICAVRYPVEKAAGRFGIIQRNKDGKVTGFDEKPEVPAAIPGDETRTLVSTGNYLFDRQVLVEALEHDAKLSDAESSHDFGRDVIPRLMRTKGLKVFAYELPDFHGALEAGAPKPGYWRDMGSVESYYEASMDLVGERPVFDLYDKSWPLYSIITDTLPPPKFFAAPYGEEPSVLYSMVSDGCVLKGCRIANSILSPEVVVEPGSTVRNSIIFDNVEIGKNCLIDKAIIDKNVKVPEGTVIYDGKVNLSKEVQMKKKKGKRSDGDLSEEYLKEHERLVDIFVELSKRAFTSTTGVVVIPRHYDVPFDFGLVEEGAVPAGAT